MIQRGKILEATLRKQEVNLSKLAVKLPWSIKTIYRHFEDDNLSLEKIAEYAKALKYPFTEEFPDLEKFGYRVLEDIPVYKEAAADPEYYRLKYEMVLEKYNNMLEKYNDLIARNLGIQ